MSSSSSAVPSEPFSLSSVSRSRLACSLEAPIFLQRRLIFVRTVRRVIKPQPINYTADECSTLNDFQASHAIHLHTSTGIKHIDTSPQLCHSHLFQITHQSPYLGWVFKII